LPGRRPPFLRPVAQRDGVGLQASVAPYEQRDLVADLQFGDGRAHLVGIAQLLVVQLQDDVAHLQSRLFGRAARLHAHHNDALRSGIAQVTSELLVERAHLDADVGMRHVDAVARLLYFREHRLGCIDGN